MEIYILSLILFLVFVYYLTAVQRKSRSKSITNSFGTYYFTADKICDQVRVTLELVPNAKKNKTFYINRKDPQILKAFNEGKMEHYLSNYITYNNNGCPVDSIIV